MSFSRVFLALALALALAPAAAQGGDVESLLNQAMVLAQAGRVPEAAPLFARVAATAPDDASVQFNAGYAHMQLRDYPRSLAYLERCIALNPGFREAHVKAASVLRELNR